MILNPSFPRLGQMILEYDPPLKKLSDEFIPHARQLVQAKQVTSVLSQVYMRRNLTAEQWRSAQMLSLVAAPQHMLHAAQTDTVIKDIRDESSAAEEEDRSEVEKEAFESCDVAEMFAEVVPLSLSAGGWGVPDNCFIRIYS